MPTAAAQVALRPSVLHGVYTEPCNTCTVHNLLSLKYLIAERAEECVLYYGFLIGIDLLFTY